MTQANIDRCDAENTVWDVVVIGGGPAGAVAARQTAGAGYRTLLVDKQSFPRGKVCGACVNARALKLLSILGMEPCVSALPSMSLDSFALHCGARHATLPLSGGKAIARDAFDNALVGEAIRSGASWLPETTATVGNLTYRGTLRDVELRSASSAAWDTDVTPACRSEHGQSSTAETSARSSLSAPTRQRNATVVARVVLVADGLGNPSLQRREDEFPCRISPSARIGVGGVVCGGGQRYAPQTIHMTVARGGYVGLVALADGSLNLAAAIDAAFLKTQSDVASAVGSILADAKMPPLDLQDVLWKGTPPLTRRLDRPASKRVLVLGDAAGYVEPFTGEGMAWAITSGAAAATLVPQGVASWTDKLADEWLGLSRNLIRQHQFICRMLARTLRSQRCAATATRILAAFPGLAAPIVNRSAAIPDHVERYFQASVHQAPPKRLTRESLAGVRQPREFCPDEF